MAKLFGCPINVEAEEEDGGGSSIAVEISRSGNQRDGEATSFSAGFPPFNQRETYPYFRFLDSNSDSGSVSMESESDLHHCFIDFFDQESYVSSNRRLSTSYDFNILGSQDMEVEIELGLRIGSRSGSDDSGGLGLQVTEIESGRVEVDTGRVEVDLSRVEVDTGRVEGDTGRVDSQNAFRWVSEPVEVNFFGLEPMDYNQEDEPMDQESQIDLFDDFIEDSLNRINEYGGDYEDVLARTFDESGINGSPPASKRVVDELPDVEITSEELSIGCAICKDEIVVEEKVKRLPCKHYYHKECIVPWLGIRNTCPVCRYELPTDDLEYERNR
ncbi:hypothetical protein N665_5370s0001, partial [Sinapis alba]